MAPVRKRTRVSSSAVRQRSIAEFFVKSPGPSAVGSPGQYSPSLSSRTQQRRGAAAGAEASGGNSPTVRRNLAKCALADVELGKEEDVSSARPDAEMAVRPAEDAAAGVDEYCEDMPMTQEEEDVNDQLKSLNCSQDACLKPLSPPTPTPTFGPSRGARHPAIVKDESPGVQFVGVLSRCAGAVVDCDAGRETEVIDIISDSSTTPQKQPNSGSCSPFSSCDGEPKRNLTFSKTGSVETCSQTRLLKPMLHSAEPAPDLKASENTVAGPVECLAGTGSGIDEGGGDRNNSDYQRNKRNLTFAKTGSNETCSQTRPFKHMVDSAEPAPDHKALKSNVAGAVDFLADKGSGMEDGGDECNNSDHTELKDQDDGDDSEKDDDNLLQDNLVQPRRSSRIRSANGSSPLAMPDDFPTPSVRRIRGSVFGGTSVKKQHNSSRGRTPSTTDLVRARNIRLEKEKGIQELRQQVHAGNGDSRSIDSEEIVFAQMAAEEDRKTKLREQVYVKYERPSPLFVCACTPAWPDYSFSKTNPSVPDALHRILVAASSHPDVPIGEVLSKQVLRSWTTSAVSACALLGALFPLVVYDGTDEVLGTRGRRDMFWTLHEILRSFRKFSTRLESEIPSLRDVLQSYGAFVESDEDGPSRDAAGVTLNVQRRDASIDDANEPDSFRALRRAAGMETGSLDYDTVTNGNDGCSKLTTRALRNLSRAFQLFEAAVSGGIPLLRLWTGASAFEENSSNDTAFVVKFIALCTRVLLSPFGSQLFREVGRLMASVLERIPESQWSAVRLQLAHVIAHLCVRLSVQVELVTYLLPYSTVRSRGMALDATYIVLRQWAAGPADNPRGCRITKLKASDSASQFGIDVISYCLSDITSTLGSFPVLDRNADVTWACGVMRLLKQAVADDDVIKRRCDGDIDRLVESIKKYRRSFVRLGDGVAVQDMRIAIDALRNVIHGTAETDANALRELNALMAKRPKQMSISSFGGVRT